MAEPFRPARSRRLRERVIDRGSTAPSTGCATSTAAARSSSTSWASSPTRCRWRSSRRCSACPRRTARSSATGRSGWPAAVDPIMGAERARRSASRRSTRCTRTSRSRPSEKRAEPTDDLMSTLVHAEIDGERLSQEELVAQLVTLYMAGHEPTASLDRRGHARAAPRTRSARAPARRPRPAAQRRLGAPALRRTEPVRAAHHHAADRWSAIPSCRPAR